MLQRRICTARKLLHGLPLARAFTTQPIREWFYYVDEQGHLYNVVETFAHAPFGPTFFRDIKFLNFFFRHIRKNDTKKHSRFPWVSPCGKELNYVCAKDTPIVYHTLSALPDAQLVYAGNLNVPFSPSLLRVNKAGRLYYPNQVCETRIEHCHIVQCNNNFTIVISYLCSTDRAMDTFSCNISVLFYCGNGVQSMKHWFFLTMYLYFVHLYEAFL